MDIILSRYANTHLAALSAEDLDLYEALLAENDQDLYQWVTGQNAAPEHLAPMVDKIAALVSARG